MSAELFAVLLAAPGDDARHGDFDDTAAMREREAAIHAHERQQERLLVERLRAGDEAAYRELVTTYAERLSRFAFGIVQMSDLADDIAQDVLTQIWAQRDTWMPAQSLKAYLFAATRNRALNHRKHERVHDRASPDIANAIADQAARTPDAIERLSQESMIVALREALVRLPERRRTALRLRYEEGLTYPAIASVLGISVKSAEQLVALTIQALRKELRRFR